MQAKCYIHGHSAGGTNPSLVEMMHFGIPVIAFDCDFNRFSTDECAFYFDKAETLRSVLTQIDSSAARGVGEEMLRIANSKYTWKEIGRKYFDLFE